MISQQEIDSYIKGAIQFPVKDERQLLSMILLRFSELDGDTAEKMVAQSIKSLKPAFWNPDKFPFPR